MSHTFNKIKSVLVLSLMLAVVIPTLSGSPAMAQNRRVMLEEFTGAWCGWCVRGALALEQLRAAYPGQVIGVSFHNDQGSPLNDQMSTPQGDSLAQGISSLSTATQVTGFPDGWTARTPIGGTWNVDPGTWIDTVNVGNGLAEQMLDQATSVVVSVDSISYNPNSGMITATVHANFRQAVSGDLRFNLYVIEDSVTGVGQGYDQHNYYYQNSNFPNSPYYDLGNPYTYNGSPDGSTIPGFYHMQVFRYAPTPIWGLKGVIPASGGSAAGKYSKTFTFPMPASIQDSTHVKLIGFVSQYSSTSAAGNGILDADMEPLLGTGPKYYITSVSVTPQTQYATAKSNGSMQDPFLFTNNGQDTVTLNLAVDQTGLPANWSASTPSDNTSITINPGATVTVNVNVTAPVQSGFATLKVTATPVKPGYVVSSVSGTGFLLSDNTKCAILYDPSSSSATPTPDAAMTSAIFPDSLKSFWAIVPLSDASIAAYPPENFPISIYDNIMCLDNGSDPNLTNPTVLPDITAALAAGNKVFISSDYALGYVMDDGSNAYYAQHIGYTATQDAIDFYNKLGLSWAQTVQHWNSSGQKLSYPIKGRTGDPVGNGLSILDGGGYFSCPYTIDSASTGSFIESKDTIGSTYIDPTTHARLVYLGFGLSEVSNQTLAKTIATNAITWLLGTSGSAGVDMPVVNPAGFTASPNPFHGTTQVTYTASQDERDVTFAAYDELGRELMSLPAHASGLTYTASFDGSSLADGTYVILVHSSKGTSEVRVVNEQ